MAKVWLKMGENFFLDDTSIQEPVLENNVYELHFNPQAGRFFVTLISENFSFNYKLYGVERPFIERVHRSWLATKGNMGILLNGVKGTGKTVTAKVLCNELKMPVILVNNNFGKMLNSFVADIPQDVVLFIDEYEKVYAQAYNSNGDEKDRGDILSLMDGVHNSANRRFFILTTNNLYVNENLISRPSRVRYLKTFGDLTPEIVEELIDDILLHKHLKQDIITFLSRMEVITMDIVKAIVEEVNIHNESPEVFKDVFNIKALERKINIYEMIKNPVTEHYDIKLVYHAVRFHRITKITKYHEGRDIYIQDPAEEYGTIHLGRVEKVLTANTYTIKKSVTNPNYDSKLAADYENSTGIYADDIDEEDEYVDETNVNTIVKPIDGGIGDGVDRVHRHIITELTYKWEYADMFHKSYSHMNPHANMAEIYGESEVYAD